VEGQHLFVGDSFNLDFHSVPYYGADPVLERHYVSARSRRQPSVLAFLAQDAEGRAFCYSNADIRKGEESDEIFRFIAFWKRTHGQNPRHLVFDSRLTTYLSLARLEKMGITFITLRRRTAKLLQEIAALPRSAWRTIELDVPTRKYKTPRIHEQTVALAGATFRQIFIRDLGHDEPTLLLTNDRRTSAPKLITRYAQRMLIENALSDAVRFEGAVPQEEVRRYLWAADVFLSLNELSNVGNPLLEAMACGKAIVTLDAGDTNELIHDAETGVLLADCG